MSFSWWCKDKYGEDLFDEYGVDGQALGLGENGLGDTHARYSVSEIRSAWCNVPYKDKLTDAARDAILSVQKMALENLHSLKPQHCDTCQCPEEEPSGWSKVEIGKLLSIPLDRVWRAGGGF